MRTKLQKVDAVFDEAIRLVSEGESFSCNALSIADRNINGFDSDCYRYNYPVENLYREVLSYRLPRIKEGQPEDTDPLLTAVNKHARHETYEGRQFRVLLLSMVKAAWRDLI